MQAIAGYWLQWFGIISRAHAGRDPIRIQQEEYAWPSNQEPLFA
jgi:hypothetical protein